MNLTFDQIGSYAAAGFSGADLLTAVAIALAESYPPGNPHSYNPEGSYGLWQIYLRDHPEFQGWDLFDPATNAHAAYMVYSKAGGSFSPWSTYKNARYLAFLPQGPLPAAPQPQPPLVLDASTGLPVPDSELPPPMMEASMLPTSGLSFGKVALWGAVGLFVLWVLEEAL